MKIGEQIRRYMRGAMLITCAASTTGIASIGWEDRDADASRILRTQAQYAADLTGVLTIPSSIYRGNAKSAQTVIYREPILRREARQIVDVATRGTYDCPGSHRLIQKSVSTSQHSVKCRTHWFGQLRDDGIRAYWTQCHARRTKGEWLATSMTIHSLDAGGAPQTIWNWRKGCPTVTSMSPSGVVTAISSVLRRCGKPERHCLKYLPPRLLRPNGSSRELPGDSRISGASVASLVSKVCNARWSKATEPRVDQVRTICLGAVNRRGILEVSVPDGFTFTGDWRLSDRGDVAMAGIRTAEDGTERDVVLLYVAATKTWSSFDLNERATRLIFTQAGTTAPVLLLRLGQQDSFIPLIIDVGDLSIRSLDGPPEGLRGRIVGASRGQLWLAHDGGSRSIEF